MKKLSAILIVIFVAGFIFVARAQANETVTQIINVIKTRGQTSTTTPTASTAVRG